MLAGSWAMHWEMTRIRDLCLSIWLVFWVKQNRSFINNYQTLPKPTFGLMRRRKSAAVDSGVGKKKMMAIGFLEYNVSVFKSSSECLPCLSKQLLEYVSEFSECSLHCYPAIRLGCATSERCYRTGLLRRMGVEPLSLRAGNRSWTIPLAVS